MPAVWEQLLRNKTIKLLIQKVWIYEAMPYVLRHIANQSRQYINVVHTHNFIIVWPCRLIINNNKNSMRLAADVRHTKRMWTRNGR